MSVKSPDYIQKYSQKTKENQHKILIFGGQNKELYPHTKYHFKGVLHPWALFLKTLCIFSKNKATLDKVSYGSGQKCSKELKNHSFTSVEAIVVKLQ